MQKKNLDEVVAELPTDERAAAEDNLDRYLTLAWEILQEIEKKELPD